jgi:hypothetical protein
MAEAIFAASGKLSELAKSEPEQEIPAMPRTEDLIRL